MKKTFTILFFITIGFTSCKKESEKIEQTGRVVFYTSSENQFASSTTVYIDGKIIRNIPYSENKPGCGNAQFPSTEIKSGKHKVKFDKDGHIYDKEIEINITANSCISFDFVEDYLRI
jgi:hypothetical protein